jgi:hypothetical protein
MIGPRAPEAMRHRWSHESLGFELRAEVDVAVLERPGR